MYVDLILPGIILGLTAGFSPGPLMYFVIRETLLYGIKNGLVASLAPILTDLPLALIVFLAAGNLERLQILPGALSVAGSIFLFYLGLEGIKTEITPPLSNEHRSGTLIKAMATNYFNPHPYIFWSTIGLPYILRGGPEKGWGFMAAFLLSLSGTKMLLSLFCCLFRGFFNDGLYRTLARLTGIILIFYAIYLLAEGVKILRHH